MASYLAVYFSKVFTEETKCYMDSVGGGDELVEDNKQWAIGKGQMLLILESSYFFEEPQLATSKNVFDARALFTYSENFTRRWASDNC